MISTLCLVDVFFLSNRPAQRCILAAWEGNEPCPLDELAKFLTLVQEQPLAFSSIHLLIEHYVWVYIWISDNMSWRLCFSSLLLLLHFAWNSPEFLFRNVLGAVRACSEWALDAWQKVFPAVLACVVAQHGSLKVVWTPAMLSFTSDVWIQCSLDWIQHWFKYSNRENKIGGFYHKHQDRAPLYKGLALWPFCLQNNFCNAARLIVFGDMKCCEAFIHCHYVLVNRLVHFHKSPWLKVSPGIFLVDHIS